MNLKIGAIYHILYPKRQIWYMDHKSVFKGHLVLKVPVGLQWVFQGPPREPILKGVHTGDGHPDVKTTARKYMSLLRPSRLLLAHAHCDRFLAEPHGMGLLTAPPAASYPALCRGARAVVAGRMALLA